jgi:histidyl-tRNA synthetase
MSKRQFIFKIIQAVFKKFGFQPLETPSLENLSVLTGKYGEEGDQLLYKILDSGDYLKKTSIEDYTQGFSTLLPKISSKGLRYDLTIPFARYVAMNRHELTFPFKRYQMQPVWRADRPQKGRYREFFQCDADVVGTSSLICEAEIVAMTNEVFDSLGINDFSIQINHRKILAGIAEALGELDKQSDLAVSLDKLTKIGEEKVLLELSKKGFDSEQLNKLKPVLGWKGNWNALKGTLQNFLKDSEVGITGMNEVSTIFDHASKLAINKTNLVFNGSLARGLTYYTGAIFEVSVNNAQMGSVCGGGRYDDLTGIFGLPDVSGVGISFGVDRIYDVMEQLKLFPKGEPGSTKVLLVAMDDQSQDYALALLSRLRSQEVSSEIYPDRVKLQKPLNYANKKGIPLVVLVGPEEIKSGKLSMKQMSTGEQVSISEEQLLKRVDRQRFS